MKRSRICHLKNVSLWHKDYFVLIVFTEVAKALKMNRPSSFVSDIYFYTSPMQKLFFFK